MAIPRLYERFQQQVSCFKEQWRVILDSEVYAKLLEVAALPKTRFELPPALWAQILFDFGVSYHRKIMNKELLLAALVPLYYGRTLSYVRSTRNMDTRQAEEYIEDQCLVFEETKPYLQERWKANCS